MIDKPVSNVAPGPESPAAGPALSNMTVGDFLELLRRQGCLPTAQPGTRTESAEATTFEREIAERNQRVASERATLERVVSLVGASPPDIQVAFLKGLAENPDERSSFMEDPAAYSINHGVMLDPALVRTMLDTRLFGEAITDRLVDKIGPLAVNDMLVGGALGPGGVAAWPAAVAAVAAVVAAAAAVVSAVTSVTKHNPGDILAMKGLGPKGVTIPGAGGVVNPAGMVTNPVAGAMNLGAMGRIRGGFTGGGGF